MRWRATGRCKRDHERELASYYFSPVIDASFSEAVARTKFALSALGLAC
jgi:hypothetical protein